MSEIRLDKYLADMRAGTRSEVKEMIRRKNVKVNGVTASRPDMKVNPAEDEIKLNNEIIEYAEFEYFMLNKPAGVLSAANDPKAVTVVDLITNCKRRDLFPVGRLDKDTEGLMLITNDGELSHELLSPKKHIDKTYYVKTDGRITENIVKSFAEGLDINICKCDDTRVSDFPEEIYHTLPAVLKVITSGEQSEATITLHEGKFHQVKRMFAAVGCRVTYLKRISMGSLHLDNDLKPGEFRALTKSEISALKNIVLKISEKEILKNKMSEKKISEKEYERPDINTMLQNVKGVIFDMDGTLLDSMDVWKQIDIEFMGERNIVPYAGMEREIEGMSFHETAVYFKEKFDLPETVEEIEDIWHKAAYDKYVNEIQLKPHAREFLEELKRRKIKLGIATSNSKNLSHACLEALGISGLFDAVVTGCDINHGKPDPEIYLTAAENMSVFPQNCLIFEDVVMGLQAGISAGMKTCAVYDDFSKAYDDEKRKMADYYISSFEELI
ncbi:MAG: pseudouridine synthase [Bacteroides sp.]